MGYAEINKKASDFSEAALILSYDYADYPAIFGNSRIFAPALISSR